MNSPKLTKIDDFTGGRNKKLRRHANKLVRCVNAIVALLSPPNNGPATAGGNPVTIIATAFDDTGAVKLRKINANGTLGEEITNDGQLIN